MSEREQRAARNESLFRDVNERLRKLNEAFTTPSERIDLICECADTTCTERVSMAPDEYEAVRADPRRFLVVPGHDVGGALEVVVERHGGYHVVEKLGASGQTAEQADPRG
jgi:hypothetical protein